MSLFRRLGTFARNLSKDIVKLRAPVTAAALVATVAGIVEPFGLNISEQTTAITGGLVGVGVVWAYITDRAGGVEVATNPATAQERVVYRSHPGTLAERVAADRERLGRP